MSGPKFNDVETWLGRLPSLIISTVERVPDSGAEFNFLVRDESGKSVNVIAQTKDGPLLVGANATLDEDILDAVHRHPDQFHVEVSAVLTNSPGVFSYTDDEGRSVPKDEFTTISLRHWIYPDALTEHELNTAVIDMFQTMSYVEGCARRLPPRQENPA